MINVKGVAGMNFADNVFYKIIQGEAPSYRVYEDENFLVILDIYPTHLGHSLILPKIPAKDIFDLNPKMAAAIYPVAAKVAHAMREVTGCDGVRIVQNSGSACGQIIFYFHMHVMPCFADDVDARFNNIAKGFTPEQFKEMADKLSDYLTTKDKV
jgi:histidine triad (HIT) family protein